MFSAAVRLVTFFGLTEAAGFADPGTELFPDCHRVAGCPRRSLLANCLTMTVVPPDQSERFALALAGKKMPYAYLTFEGESHGFRRADTVIRCLEAELAFYGQTLGFEPRGVAPSDLPVG